MSELPQNMSPGGERPSHGWIRAYFFADFRFGWAGASATPVFSLNSSILSDASAFVISSFNLLAGLPGEGVNVGFLRRRSSAHRRWSSRAGP